MSLQKHETKHIQDIIKRKLTKTELQIIAAEWSEHCSYKSSKKHLKMLPTTGRSVILEKGYDSGVLDVGDGYVVTVHIESHNHPSAIEPFGGAATGVGGVIRDIYQLEPGLLQYLMDYVLVILKMTRMHVGFLKTQFQELLIMEIV